jgi:hypothetical protein
MPSFNIGQIGGLFRNLGGQASRLLQKDSLSGALRAKVSPRGYLYNKLSPKETAKAFVNERGTQAGLGMMGLGTAGLLTGNIENTLNQVGPAVDRTISNIVPDNIENWAGRTAREMEKMGLEGLSGTIFTLPLAAAQTYGQTGGYNTVQRPLGTKSQLGGYEVEWKGPDLEWQRTYSENAKPQRPLGTLSKLGGYEVEWRGPGLEWQRTYSEGANPPPPAPGSLQDLSSGRQAGQVGSNVISNGAGVPAQRSDVINRALSQEILNAAQQFNAPANIPLSSYYEGQQQLGRSMMQNGTLVSQLQELGGAPGMTPENLKTWAEKNPALAYRELLKRRGVQ